MNRPMRLAQAAALAAVVAGPAAAADVWQIDPAHSSAQFSVTHLMISTVRGEFSSLSGNVAYDGKSVSSVQVDVTIDAKSITTRNEYRDNDLRSDHFFDVAHHPIITFRSKKVIPGGGGAFKLVGDLTMRGVTKEVTLDVTAPSPIIKGPRGESRVAASATTKINRRDFGVSWNAPLDGGGVVVSDTVSITLDIEAMSPPPAAPAAPAKR